MALKPIVLPGLLIEYLVIGAVALPWAVLLIDPKVLEEFKNVSAIAALVLVPGVYVIGMIVDFVAFAFVSAWGKYSIKSLIRERVQRRKDLADFVRQDSFRASGVGATARRQIVLALDKPELAMQVELRSSRDRIARGTCVNLAIALLLVDKSWTVAIPGSAGLGAGGLALWAVLLALLLVSMFMWVYFEANSYAYELRLQHILNARGLPGKL